MTVAPSRSAGGPLGTVTVSKKCTRSGLAAPAGAADAAVALADEDGGCGAPGCRKKAPAMTISTTAPAASPIINGVLLARAGDVAAGCCAGGVAAGGGAAVGAASTGAAGAIGSAGVAGAAAGARRVRLRCT